MKKLILLFAILFSLFQSKAQYVNMAISLDGINDYVEVFDATSLDLMGQMTICAWYYFVPGSPYEPGLVQKDGPGSWGRYGLWLYGTYYPDFCLYQDGGYQICYTSNAALAENAWNHLAATYDGSVMFLYLNCQLLGYLQDAFTISTSNQSLFIGADPGDDDFTTGKIDEVSIWNVYKAQSEIQEIMGDTLPPSVYMNEESGLVAYYRFDKLEDLGVRDDGPDDIRDFSVEENHGDAQGSPALVLSDLFSSVKDVPVASLYGLTIYPDPDVSAATIQFQLRSSAWATVNVRNLIGEEVATLFNGRAASGVNQVTWSTTSLPAGMYLCTVNVGGSAETRKFILAK